MTYLQQYYNEIITGKIIAGQEMIQELRNLIEDLDNPRYKYDTSEAKARILFMEMKCKQSKKPFYLKPLKLLLWQKAFLEVLYSFKIYDEELGRWKKRFNEALLLIARKNGKCLALDTPIQTTNGIKMMGDLKVGDYVYSIDGKPTRINYVSPVFTNHKCYELEFEDGEIIVANADHIWEIEEHVTVTTEWLWAEAEKDIWHGVPLMNWMGYKSIIRIEEVQSVPVKCIAVDHPSHLYLCGNKNTVTHNTTFMAADAEYDLWAGDGGQDIVCGSNDDKTASLLWNEIEGMRGRLDRKMKWTHKNLTEIYHKKNNIHIFKMSGKSQNKDGRNIDKFLFDESHDAPDDELANAGKKSQSAKEEPMFINLTTEGFGVKDCYLDRKLIYARAIINKEIEDETFLPWLYTQDSENEIWQDEQSWYKSNPSLGVIKKWSQLRSEVEKSKLDKTTRVHTLTKDFNIKQNSAEAWLMPEDYQYEATFNLEDFRDSFCVGAVDLSETTDLTCAKILLMKKNDSTKYVYTRYWIPEAKLSDSNDKKAGAKYEEWIKEGLIELTQGTDNDVSKVADWFASLKKDYNIRCIAVGYDVRSSKPFTDKMDYYGIDVVKVLQNRYTLSEPMKLVERDLKLRVLNYNENPIDQWCFGNSVIDIDTMCRIMCIKLEKQKRIDGAVTTIILYWMFREYQNELMRKLK